MRLGLDIGSTTIKCIILDDNEKLIYSAYERHYSHIREKTLEMLEKADHDYLKGRKALFALSGSAGMGLAERCGIPFIQEVFADRVAAERLQPGTDCIIELGGEDAKIVFLSGGMEIRMNGSCAGGTGAFIDQMAALLKMEADEMDTAALGAKRTYTIASRCGVFAKSDIQPLINQGAERSDIAASIYQAVVNQTITGLAQGRKISGNVLYLGGPLTFSRCLRSCFDKTLGIHGICPENSLLYVALGAALYADQESSISEAIEKIREDASVSRTISLPPLFRDRDEYWKFHLRHAKAKVPRVKFDETQSPLHIGIDSGSTTIKIAVINNRRELVFTDYRTNDGNPVPLLKETLLKLYHEHPGMKIASVTATGYGEELIRHAFRCDFGIVETAAHFLAAKHFRPDVDFIIDIGGQDMKCFRIEDNAVSDIFLNEACSSGCGSFLQTFASALGSSVEDFALGGLYARHPVDLGSRCTVFMNSSVKQAQKDGASIEDISAGLSISVVKNALYKVIRCSSPDELGKNIVVQGGTFYNEAVLRAFEKELGRDVIRPDIAGLMGAYGAALYGLDHTSSDHISTLISEQELLDFTQQTSSIQCQGCGNHCLLTISRFSDGTRHISGNRCEKPVTGKKADDSLNLYAWKLKKIRSYGDLVSDGSRGTIGIPMCLNMYELLPFWHTLFDSLGFRVIISPLSDRKLYQSGTGTIPSDTVCFPAKLSHGHIAALCEMHPDAIFYPCMSYNVDEGAGDNHYNCPVVAYYPEIIADNCRELEGTDFIYDYFDISRKKDFPHHISAVLMKHFPSLSRHEIMAAAEKAYQEYDAHMAAVREKAQAIIQEAREKHMRIIVLAGRPYHIDPEINHGIDGLIARQNAAVITEDSVSHLAGPFKTAVLNQWTYHSRLYAAAHYCISQPDMELVQMVSFGCGLDAVTTDEVREILRENGRLYTQLKIDEITNLGAVNIRIRSLFEALKEREETPWNI